MLLDAMRTSGTCTGHSHVMAVGVLAVLLPLFGCGLQAFLGFDASCGADVEARLLLETGCKLSLLKAL